MNTILTEAAQEQFTAEQLALSEKAGVPCDKCM